MPIPSSVYLTPLPLWCYLLALPHDPRVWFAQTLSFDAYFQEAVHERQDEHFRVRKCKIFFFPEDDTLEIIEPVKSDSGLPQGTEHAHVGTPTRYTYTHTMCTRTKGSAHTRKQSAASFVEATTA